MEIHSIGYHHPHEANFVIDRPDGIGQSWLFLLFQTNALVRKNGMDICVSPNTFLLYANDEPEYYAALESKYMDDWFHFTVEPMDIQLFHELAIPINQPVHLENGAEIAELVRSMTYEFHNSKPYHMDLTELYMKILFFKIGRQLQMTNLSEVQKSSVKKDNLSVLHYHIFNQVEQIQSVEQLARDMSMSLSSLQHSYKQTFGETISHDITKSRLEKAKLLLSTTPLLLRQIAEQCGYSSEFHFMRQFKMHLGVTPSEFRRKRR